MPDADRRLGKLRVTQAAALDGEGLQKTPSQLKHLPQHLSPIRSNPSLPSVQRGDLPQGSVDIDLAMTTLEPTLTRRKRTSQRIIALSVAVVALVVLIVVLRPGTPEVKPVVAEPVKLAEVPRPVEPPRPVVPVPDVKPVEPTPEVKKPVVVKGRLTLDTAPWSEVFLKGRKLGDTPLVNYALPPGIHVLTLVNEQKNVKQVIEVEIQSGKITVKKLKL